MRQSADKPVADRSGAVLFGRDHACCSAMRRSSPFSQPVAQFIVKCRYLTLTGLIFIFTLLTRDGRQLKLWLLLFGIVPFLTTSFLSIILHTPAQEFELCQTLGYNRWESLYEVIIVGKADQVFEVVRQNFAIAWMMITMVEGLNMSEGGIGALMIKYNKYNDLPHVLAPAGGDLRARVVLGLFAGCAAALVISLHKTNKLWQRIAKEDVLLQAEEVACPMTGGVSCAISVSLSGTSSGRGCSRGRSFRWSGGAGSGRRSCSGCCRVCNARIREASRSGRGCRRKGGWVDRNIPGTDRVSPGIWG